MKLETLHKRLALQAMNPKDPLGAEKARSVGYSITGKFVSLFDIFTKNNDKKYGVPKTRKKRAPRKKKDGQSA